MPLSDAESRSQVRYLILPLAPPMAKSQIQVPRACARWLDLWASAIKTNGGPLPSNRLAYWRCDGGVRASYIVHSLGCIPRPWLTICARRALSDVIESGAWSLMETHHPKKGAPLHHLHLITTHEPEKIWLRNHIRFTTHPTHRLTHSSSSYSSNREKEGSILYDAILLGRISPVPTPTVPCLILTDHKVAREGCWILALKPRLSVSIVFGGAQNV